MGIISSAHNAKCSQVSIRIHSPAAKCTFFLLLVEETEGEGEHPVLLVNPSTAISVTSSSRRLRSKARKKHIQIIHQTLNVVST